MTAMTTTAAAAAGRRGSGAGDLGRLIARALRHETCTVDALIVNIAMPVAIMVVFVYVFGGAITTGSSGLEYIDFAVPGVLVMCAGYGAALTAVSMAEEMTGGMIDRFRTLPIGAWTVPAALVIASVVRNVATTGIALAVAVVLGFRPDATPAGWVLTAAVVAGYVLAMSALAVLWGLMVTSTQAAGAFSFVVLFLPYLSDTVVPAETMPGALRAFAEHQPITPLVETLRGLLLDRPIGDSGWIAAAWLAGAVVVATPLAAARFRRRTSA
ncbi:ABC-2 type transport system permease protein [Thermocatellispora tengchongensis]|uniref:Transport permease protein n=1 Tax=Thermocatellispora tengchongensis TaxID=1073253 RepID=A0A840PKT9_9ACTN|nr:ABC transporter permease [Thermocatellispora tengchongensis]MBB5139536.1 ABC-2 type transport system permease protein [Thermocatellispora tengchongensis]